MNEKLKSSCLEALRHPHDQAALLATADRVVLHDAGLGARLRAFVLDGKTEPNGFQLGGDGKTRREAQYVVMRAIPFRTAVRFGVACVRRAWNRIEQVHPADAEFQSLIELVEAWTRSEATQKAVRQRLVEVQKLGEKIDKEWHRRYGDGEFDSLSKFELGRTNAPLFAISATLSLAGAVTAAYRHRLPCLDEVVGHCLDVASCDGRSDAQDSLVQWMKASLAEFVRAEPTTS